MDGWPISGVYAPPVSLGLLTQVAELDVVPRQIEYRERATRWTRN